MSLKEAGRDMKKNRRWLAGPYYIWILGFIILPLLTIIYFAFTKAEGGFTFENIIAVVTDEYTFKALGLSLQVSIISTVLCLLLAYPLAMCLNKLKMKSKSFIVYLFILPIWLNFMLQMVSITILIEDNGVLNFLLTKLGLPELHIMSTKAAIIIGMVYDYFPFMLLPIYNSVADIDHALIDASKDLGANPIQTFVKVTLPLSLKGVISGITMVFIPAISDFAIAEMLGGGKVLLIGNIVESNFTKGYYHTGSGLAVVLMLFVLLSIAISERKEGASDEK